MEFHKAADGCIYFCRGSALICLMFKIGVICGPSYAGERLRSGIEGIASNPDSASCISANVNPVSLILGRVAFSYHQYYKILSVDFNN